MRISRPCYDKPHRCPGWAGGGMHYAKVVRCDNGRTNIWDLKLWKWRFAQCDTCDVRTIPWAITRLSPSNIKYNFSRRWNEFLYNRRFR